MRVELTDEQQFLQEAVAGTVAREATLTAVREWAQNGDHSPADTLAARQGWTGIGLAEESGGQGGGLVELAVMAEQLGAAAVPWDRTLAGCLTGPLLASTGTELGAALALQTAAGFRVSILCVDGGRPPSALPEAAIADGDARVEATYVLGAAAADELILPVDDGDEIALYAVPVTASGVLVQPRVIVDRTRSLAAVTLNGAPAKTVGTVPRAAFRAAAARAAVLAAADALGTAGTLLALTTAYVADRRQFSVPVGSFQAVKHAVAEMLVDVEASRSAVQYAAWAVDAQSDDALVQASIAKAYACAAAARVADKALFLHGAIGYTWEHDLQFLFKRAKSDLQLFGTPDHHLDLIAAHLPLMPAGERTPQPVG
jgi:alkylation response protein AidB-like acyl-CoA dehydrogenase